MGHPKETDEVAWKWEVWAFHDADWSWLTALKKLLRN
jgi:hypothetical protein